MVGLLQDFGGNQGKCGRVILRYSEGSRAAKRVSIPRSFAALRMTAYSRWKVQIRRDGFGCLPTIKTGAARGCPRGGSIRLGGGGVGGRGVGWGGGWGGWGAGG